MEVTIILFFLVASAIIALLGYVFKNAGLAGLGAMGFVLTGLSFLLAGVDVQAVYSTTQLTNSTDLYAYNWNASFNQTTIANITTNMTRLATQNYSYNNVATDYTRLIALIIVFAGMALAVAAFSAWQETREQKQE